MMTHTSLLLTLVLLITNSHQQQAPIDGYLKREHSLLKPYSGNGMSIPMWDFRGNVIMTNNFIRLTQDHQGKQGAIWNRIPCFVRNWELLVQMHVHGGGRTLAADGMAIWYTKQRMEPGPVFGSRDNFHGLALFLDTYKNGPQAVTFPFITAMISNGSESYDHANDGRTNSIGNCLASFRNKDYDTYLRIRYVNKHLSVDINVDDSDEFRECFSLPGVTLPTGYFFGASAATGDLADNHDLLSMRLYEIEVEQTQEEGDPSTAIPGVSFFKPPIDNVEDGGVGGFRNSAMSGFKLFLLIVCVLLGIAVCVVVGFVVFQKRQEQNRKRFY